MSLPRNRRFGYINHEQSRHLTGSAHPPNKVSNPKAIYSHALLEQNYKSSSLKNGLNCRPTPTFLFFLQLGNLRR